MYNSDFEHFKDIAKGTSELLLVMSDLWEKMQAENNEPKCLGFGNELYPCDISFDEFTYKFREWVNTLDY